MVKSPRSLRTFPDYSSELVTSIIFEHLDKYFEISKFNTSALYDKGLMFRHFQRSQKALCIFKQLMKEKYSINTYELAAYCAMDSVVSDATKDFYFKGGQSQSKTAVVVK